MTCPPCAFDRLDLPAGFEVLDVVTLDSAGVQWYDGPKYPDDQVKILVTGDGGRWSIGNAEKYREFGAWEIKQIFGCTIDEFKPTIADDHVVHGNISAPLTRYRYPKLHLCQFGSCIPYLAESPVLGKMYDGRHLFIDSIEDLQCALGTVDIFKPIALTTFSGDQIHIGNRTFTSGSIITGEISRMIRANSDLKAQIAELTEQMANLQAANMKLNIRLQSK